MTSPYIRLTKGAINAKLKQNEGLIFHALMMQTLGFRKTIDNLTDKRLAQLTGIRLDHLRPALESFLSHNLFYRIEHRDYDYQYRICDEFLDDAQSTIVYPPTLPKTGKVRESWEDFPEVGEDSSQTSGKPTKVRAYSPPTSVKSTELGGYTTENLNIKKPPPLKTPILEKQQPQTETKKTDFIKKQPQPKTEKTDFIEKQPQPKTEKTDFVEKQPQPKTEKTDFVEKQQQPFVTTISMTGLEKMPDEFVIESSGSVRFEFSAKTAKTVMQTVEKTDQAIPETITETNVEPIAEPVTETNVEPITEPIAKTNVDPITEPIAKTITKPTTKPIPETVAKTATNTTTKPIGELVAAIIPDLNQKFRLSAF